MAPDAPLLLLVDYLETQSAFEQITAFVSRLNTGKVANIRVIANCRTSYYRSEIAYEAVSVFDLSESALLGSEFDYRKEVFFHILGKAGLGRPEAFGMASGHNPVLAAFVLYLVEGSADRPDLVPELRRLVDDVAYRRDLSAWLVRRLLRSAQATIGSMTVGTLVRTVAPLMAVLPLWQNQMLLLRGRAELAEFLTLLTHDRLVEDRPWRGDPRWAQESHRWVATHDIVADYFLGRFFDTTPDIEAAVDSIFSLAADVGAVKNAIVSIQRVAEAKRLAEFGWHRYFARKIRSCHPAWLNARRELLRSLLLNPGEKVALLHDDESAWADLRWDSKLDRIFIKVTSSYVGWLNSRDGPPVARDEQTLLPYLEAAVGRDPTFRAISRAVRYAPSHFQERVLDLVEHSPLTPQFADLLTAWLVADLDFARIEQRTLAWLNFGFAISDDASFVFFEALANAIRAGDEAEIIRRIKLLQPHFEQWMAEENRASSIEAGFLYSAWLRAAARADREAAIEAIEALSARLSRWVEIHALHPDAHHVLSYWVRAAHAAGSLATNSVVQTLQQPTLDWLEKWSATPGSRLICGAWLVASRRTPSLARDALATLRPHLQAWLDSPDSSGDRAAYLLHDWLLTAAKGGRETSLETVELLADPILNWLQPDWRPVSTRAELIYMSWSRAVSKLDDAARIAALDALAPFYNRWRVETGASQQATKLEYIERMWEKARAGSSDYVLEGEQWNTLREIVHRLGDETDEAAVSASAETERLQRLSRSFSPPVGLSKKGRKKVLYWIIRILEPLIRFPQLHRSLGAFLLTIGQHPDLLNEPLPRGGTLRLTHLVLLEQALGQATSQEDLAALRRVIRYLMNLPPNALQKDMVGAELARLRAQYPSADLWQGNAGSQEIG